MGLGQAIKAEAQAPATGVTMHDLERASQAFIAKRLPVFEGNWALGYLGNRENGAFHIGRFFEVWHRMLAHGLEDWATGALPVDRADVDDACKRLVRALRNGGWLWNSGGRRWTYARAVPDPRPWRAMTGLGRGPVAMFGRAL